MSASYRPTIGLEVHAELRTQTKMFCVSRNDPDETRPNVNICPVCLAHPGTLPAANKEAVHHVLRVGAALGSTIADYTEFDRKSYFYPDIPKGYQISQYEHPLVKGGSLNGVAITRVHLEEDTARSSHEGEVSLVDFNRAGVPLMELVTEPVMHDAKTAGDFARELQLLLKTLGVSEANLEKGEMRIEANVSVSKSDTPSKDYVELKNINSFRAVERAIAYEIDRQIAVLEKGERVVKATRGWNEDKQETFHQRFKEGGADYRYFPEPDLPKLVLSEIPEFSKEALKATMPELPWEKRERLVGEGVAVEAANILVSDSLYGDFHAEEIATLPDAKLRVAATNILMSDVRGKNPGAVELERLRGAFSTVMAYYAAEKLSSTSAKAVIAELLEKGGNAEEVAKGKLQVSDEGALLEAIRGVIRDQGVAVAEYRGGKENALQFLVGASMKATKGAGNPGLIRELLQKELS